MRIEHLLFFRARGLCVQVSDSSHDCQTNWRRDGDMTCAKDVKWGGERMKPVCLKPGYKSVSLSLCHTFHLLIILSRHSNEKAERQFSDLCIDATATSRRKKLMLDQNKKFIKLWLMILSFNRSTTAGTGNSKSFRLLESPWSWRQHGGNLS